MNIVFLTSESAHHYYLINEIHKAYPVKKVFFQASWKKKRTWKERFQRWRKFKNIVKTVRGILNRLLYSGEEALEERYERKMFFNGAAPVMDPSIPFKHVSSFNGPQAVAEVNKECPDLIIVFGTDILKGDILRAAKINILNIHRGITPEYCGGSVATWAFYNNDFDHLGATVHVCTVDLDAGDIVGQAFYRLEKDDQMYKLRYKTTLVALEVLKEVLNRYHAGSVEYRKQGPVKTWKSKDMTLVKKFIARQNFKNHVRKISF